MEPFRKWLEGGELQLPSSLMAEIRKSSERQIAMKKEPKASAKMARAYNSVKLLKAEKRFAFRGAMNEAGDDLSLTGLLKQEKSGKVKAERHAENHEATNGFGDHWAQLVGSFSGVGFETEFSRGLRTQDIVF